MIIIIIIIIISPVQISLQNAHLFIPTTLYIAALLSGKMSVCLSVTRRYYVETAKLNTSSDCFHVV